MKFEAKALPAASQPLSHEHAERGGDDGESGQQDVVRGERMLPLFSTAAAFASLFCVHVSSGQPRRTDNAIELSRSSELSRFGSRWRWPP